MGACSTGLIVLATILGPVTLVFLAVSFGTDSWLVYNVNRSKLTPAEKTNSETNLVVARYTHTRERGLFRECYRGNDTKFLDTATDKIDGYCFYVKYELPENTAIAASSEYMARLHLLRSFLAFYIMALVFFVAAYIFGLVLCCWRISRWAYIAGLCAYISAFCTAAGIAFFHGAEYLERNKIDEMGFYQQWSSTLKDATSRSYGFSYALGWVGMILAAFTATFYSLAGCYITSDRYEDSREIMDKRSHYGRDYPMIMNHEPVYAVEDPYYGQQKGYYGYPRGGYVGPYVYDRPSLERSMPAAAYGPQDTWQWREVSN